MQFSSIMESLTAIMDWISPSSIKILGAILVSCLLYRLHQIIYLLYFHPLSKFPGPKLAAISNFLHSTHFLNGTQPQYVLKLHEKYGPVVRTSPNELSFSSASSWHDIYGQRPGHETYVKSSFYEGGNFANQALSIVSERDPAKHRDMRKYLSNAFSDRSLKDQEYLISNVIDEFISQIGKLGQDEVDLTMWFNLMTFDIIGELAFGESFGGIASGKLHFWIATVLGSMGQASLSDTLARFPLLGKIWMRVNPGWLRKLTEESAKHESYTLKLVDRRIRQKDSRKDFMTTILEQREKYGISNIQLAAHASDFVIAGSETTATTLATVTYYLFRNPHVLSKLQHEIRSAFQFYEEINWQSTTNLSYLHAVCLEALRVFPPLPLGLPRVVPEGGDIVDGHFIPGGIVVSTNPFAASMSATNFKDPWRFDPERWIGQNEADILDTSQPFSVGTRACLGRSLGWMELHTTLAKIHYKYDLELKNVELDWQKQSRMHLLWQKPKMLVRVKERKGVVSH